MTLDEALYLAFEQKALRDIAKLPSQEELDATIFPSPEFERKMKRVIRMAERRYVRILGHTFRRAAVVAALIAALLTTAMAVPAVRGPIVRFFVEVFETLSEITLIRDAEPETVGEFEYIYPETPEGYQLTFEEKMKSSLSLEWESLDGADYIMYSQYSTAQIRAGLDTESAEMSDVTVKEYKGKKYSNKGENNLVWYTDHYYFTLAGTCDFDVLFSIAEKIS